MATQSLVALSDLDLIEAALVSMIIPQSTQNFDLLSYSSLLLWIEERSIILTIPNKNAILNPHNLLLDELKSVFYVNAVLKH